SRSRVLLAANREVDATTKVCEVLVRPVLQNRLPHLRVSVGDDERDVPLVQVENRHHRRPSEPSPFHTRETIDCALLLLTTCRIPGPSVYSALLRRLIEFIPRVSASTARES